MHRIVQLMSTPLLVASVAMVAPLSVQAAVVKVPVSSTANAEKKAAAAQIKKAFELSKRQPAFKKATTAKDMRSIQRILIANGAPADTVAGPGADGGQRFIKITLTCCRRKPWGPVVVVLEL